MPDVNRKGTPVSQEVASQEPVMVVGDKIDWSVVSKEVTEMKKKLVVVHEAIGKIWKDQKSRDLATLESCVRNVVGFLDRIPSAATKFGSTTVSSKGKGTSLLSKPR